MASNLEAAMSAAILEGISEGDLELTRYVDLMDVASKGISKASKPDQQILFDVIELSTAELIKALQEEQRKSVKRIMARSALKGWDDLETARAIRRVVGLDERRQIQVENHYQGLIDQGIPWGKARNLSAKFGAKLRSARAMQIAGEERFYIQMATQRGKWQQMYLQGKLPKGVRRMWITKKDERVCIYCGPLHRKTAPLNGGYQRKKQVMKRTGERRYFGNISGPPIHVRCRCKEVLATKTSTGWRKYAP